jgi:hypothetical protein
MGQGVQWASRASSKKSQFVILDEHITLRTFPRALR